MKEIINVRYIGIFNSRLGYRLYFSHCVYTLDGSKMTKWVWTRIKDTELFEAARHEIALNTLKHKLHYHTIEHVQAMYQYLELSDEPYDELLDWAVLFHDLVYDNKPNKELRSGIRFLELSMSNSGCSLVYEQKVAVVRMILDTETHENVWSPLVRADLHQLADPLHTFRNFNSIMLESINLYGVPERVFATNSEQYMRGLSNRLNKAFEGGKPSRLWGNILKGVESTIQLARIIQGK